MFVAQIMLPYTDRAKRFVLSCNVLSFSQGLSVTGASHPFFPGTVIIFLIPIADYNVLELYFSPLIWKDLFKVRGVSNVVTFV